MTDVSFVPGVSQYQEILSKTRLFGTGKYSELGNIQNWIEHCNCFSNSQNLPSEAFLVQMCNLNEIGR